MAILSAKERDKLPASAFAIPEKRAYPIHDIEHARAALSMVAKNGTPAEQARVKAAVHKRYPTLGQEDAKSKEGSTSMDNLIRTRFGKKKMTVGGGISVPRALPGAGA